MTEGKRLTSTPTPAENQTPQMQGRFSAGLALTTNNPPPRGIRRARAAPIIWWDYWRSWRRQVADRRKFRRDICDAVGRRSFAPLLLAASLLGFTPVDAVPGVATLLAIVIVLVAGQVAVGSQSLRPRRLGIVPRRQYV